MDPSAGPAAVRLLTGARWNLGLQDLVALEGRAKELTGRRTRDQGEPADGSRDVVRDALRQAAFDEMDAASLLDAVADPGEPHRYSAEGFERIGAFARELTALRRRLGGPLPDLLVDVERETGLDVEVALAGGRGRANLDALADVVAEFVTSGGSRSVPTDAVELDGTRSMQVQDLLGFLDVAAEQEEGLELGEVEQSAAAVQLLTVHAAKGLEWELVGVPHLSRTVFPSALGGSWLTADSSLPPELRGDRADVPGLSLPPGSRPVRPGGGDQGPQGRLDRAPADRGAPTVLRRGDACTAHRAVHRPLVGPGRVAPWTVRVPGGGGGRGGWHGHLGATTGA